RNRHLAWAEAGDTRLGLDLNELPFDSLREIGGREHHFEFPLEPLRVGLRDLHLKQTFLDFCRFPFRQARLLNRAARHSGQGLVRAEGIEPPRFSPPEPKSGASTSSATPATC